MLSIHKRSKAHRIISFVLNLALIFYSLAPGLSSTIAYAQEVTPPPVVEPTAVPTETPAPQPTETVTPTPSLDPSPTVTPDITLTPTPELSPTPTETITPTVQPENTPTSTPSENTNQPNAPPTGEQPTQAPEITPAESPTPTITTIPTPEIQGSLHATILENTDAQTLQLDLATQDVSSASLVTDKADYAPTDAAVITGSDFPKEADLKLIITADNYRFEASVKTDSNGSFIYSYQLDGTYRPLYKVEANDLSGTLLATVTFTDSPVKITAKEHEGQEKVSGVLNGYTSGNVTEYAEGDTINFRFGLEATHGPTSGQLEIRYTGDDGTCLFFDGSFALGSIEAISGSQPTVTTTGVPTQEDFGTSNGEWVQILNINYPGTFGHNDPDSKTRVNYTLKLSNEAGQCNGSSQHSRLNPAGGAVEQSGQQNVPVPANQVIELPDITVIKNIDRNGDGNFESTAAAGEYSFTLDGITTLSTNASGQAIFTDVTPDGTHTITETQIDFSQGTYQFTSGSGTNCSFSGSTATATIASGTTATNATCIFNNAQQRGTVVVHKDVQGPNGEDITDTSNTFKVKLDGANEQNITDNGTVTYSDVLAGSHTVTESVIPAGYTLYGISTTPGGSGNTGGLSVSVTAGQTTDVYVTNRQQQTKLTLVKTVINDNGGTKVVSDFVLKIDGTQVTSGVTNNVTAGAHTASEVNLSGYSASSWGGDCNADGTITLALGANKTCTITNDDIQPKLTVTKVVVNDNGGTKVVSDFPLFVDQTSVISGVQNGFNVGTYTVSETGQGGYTGTISGDCAQNGGITLAIGDVKSCTITNDDQPGSISGMKFKDKNGNGIKDGDDTGLSEWTINLSGPVNASIQTDGSGNYTFSNLPVGTYTVTENTKTGWMQTTSNPAPINLTNGQGVTGINFGNFKLVTISGKKFNDLNGNHVKNEGEPGLSGWVISLDKENNINPPVCTGGTIVGELCVKTTNSSGNYSFTNLQPGTYRISETLQTNWTQTRPGFFNSTLYGGQGAQVDGTYLLTVVSGNNITSRDFGNFRQARIIVVKDVVDPNGNPIDDTSTDFNFDMTDQEGSFQLNDGESEDFDVDPGTYEITEDPDNNYTFEGCDIGEPIENENGLGVEVSVESGQNITVTCTNKQKPGTITGMKWDDRNGNGRNDEEPGLLGWHIQLFEDNDGGIGEQVGEDELTNQDGSFTFESINPGNYWLCEVNQGGWNQTYPDNDSQHPRCWEINIASNGSVEGRDFGNKQENPILTISKSNDKTGVDLQAGSSVMYTLVIEATQSAALDVVVKDLLPDGFTYRSGSWTVNSSTRGNITSLITEPVYASPGTWNLGNMAVGEKITLTYIADIAGDKQPGLYKDLAWAFGCSGEENCSVDDENAVFASAQDPGFVDTNFVGTQVNIVKNPDGTGANIEREETKSEVLGISTSMPATGANSFWLILAGILLSVGTVSTIAGIKSRRKNV